MNEEEFKIINKTKKYIEMSSKTINCDSDMQLYYDICDLDILIKIIEKQQNEIEKLKDSNNKLYEIGQEIIKQDKYTSQNYIPKSKIEEKIEELEAMSISEEIYYDDVVKMFKQLLESEE